MIGIYDKDGLVRHMFNNEEYEGIIKIDEIPKGQYILKIDTSDGTPKPIFADVPKTEIEQRLENLELGYADILGGK